MILYMHMKCSTCKDALRFLESENKTVTMKDIVQMPPSKEELRAMLGYVGGNIKKLLNTSGQLYREMGLSEKLVTMSEDEILTLLSSHGMLIKRPFLLGKDFGLVGFKEEAWAQAFHSGKG